MTDDKHHISCAEAERLLSAPPDDFTLNGCALNVVLDALRQCPPDATFAVPYDGNRPVATVRIYQWTEE
jgi:hypothetical protein